MASIGGRSVISVGGAMNLGTGENLEHITRPHVDGVAYRKVGKRGKPFNLQTVVDLGSGVACKTELEVYKDLQGTLVTVQDDVGVQFTNLAVLEVQRVSVVQVISPVGGVNGGNHLLRCAWTLQPTDVS